MAGELGAEVEDEGQAGTFTKGRVILLGEKTSEKMGKQGGRKLGG